MKSTSSTKKSGVQPLEVKRYTLLNSEGEHEFNIVSETSDAENKIKLYASNSEIWLNNIRGNLILTLIDNGNGLRFDGTLQWDYATPLQMKLLLNFYYDVFNEFDYRYKLIEESEFITI